ncbi:hypothetical protein Tco_1091269, partial [Tanacetum coccineum]
ILDIQYRDRFAVDDALVLLSDRLMIGKIYSFYKAFPSNADAPEIICKISGPYAYVGNKKFEEPPLEKEILAFLASLGHSGDIRKITDVNVNNTASHCTPPPPWRYLLLSSKQCLSRDWSNSNIITNKKPSRTTALLPVVSGADEGTDDEDDEEHDDNETDQNDDDEEQTESDDDGDDFVHPKLTTS